MQVLRLAWCKQANLTEIVNIFVHSLICVIINRPLNSILMQVNTYVYENIQVSYISTLTMGMYNKTSVSLWVSFMNRAHVQAMIASSRLDCWLASSWNRNKKSLLVRFQAQNAVHVHPGMYAQLYQMGNAGQSTKPGWSQAKRMALATL